MPEGGFKGFVHGHQGEWVTQLIVDDQEPTEAEWELAARGTEGRLYPWGKTQPGPELLNFNGNVGAVTPVGVYPEGSTPEGVLDLAGNAWEWCAD